MKSLIKIIAIACLLMGSGMAKAQGYKLKDGKITAIDTAKRRVKKADEIFTVHDAQTFYKGPKGGIYWLNESGKKIYVPKSKN